MKKYYLIFAVILVFILTGCGLMNKSRIKFGVAYGKIKLQGKTDYNVLIIEPDHYNKQEIDELKRHGIKVIAYLSLGEVDSSRWYFPYLKERGLLGKNPDWNSYYVNLADSGTIRIFLQEILPNIMIKGFDGLFFDTVDAVAPYTPYHHLKEAMVKLIQQIHLQYPESYLIQNAGIFLIDETHSFVDGLLLEDVASGYDFKTNQYLLKDENAFHKRISELKQLYKNYHLDIFIVDYADTPQRRKIIQQRLKKTPFYWFIGKIELSTILE